MITGLDLVEWQLEVSTAVAARLLELILGWPGCCW
jgi:hypothetical protein